MLLRGRIKPSGLPRVVHLHSNEKVLLLLLQLLLTTMLVPIQRVGSLTLWSADRQIRRLGVQTVKKQQHILLNVFVLPGER